MPELNSKHDVRIAFIGCVEEGRRCLEALLALGETVVAIFTLRPELAAKVSGSVGWEDIAAEHGVPLHYVKNMNDEEPIAILRSARPDLVFCVGWTQLLREAVLEIPRLGCLGFHASLLPKYRGRAPVNWAIINGEKETGNTMIFLDTGVDTGDIVAQRRFPIDHADTCATVYDKVARSAIDMIRDVMPRIHAGHIPRTVQDHAQATVMPRRRPDDGVIDWRRNTAQLHDWVRALTHPYPGAFTTVGRTRVFVWKATPWRPGPGGPDAVRPRAGWLRLEGDPPFLLAGTGDGDLRLDVVQAAGEPEIEGVTFGRRIRAAGVEILGEIA